MLCMTFVAEVSSRLTRNRDVVRVEASSADRQVPEMRQVGLCERGETGSGQ